jgi:small-conductance mechanosensitive channel
LRLPEWSALFARESLGFDRQTPLRAYEDARVAIQRLAASPEAVAAWAAHPGWIFWAGVSFLLVLIAAALAIERVRPDRWRRFWLQGHAAARGSAPLRLLLRLAQRMAPPAAALACWTLGGLLTGAQGGGFELARSLLVVWTAYRGLDELALRAGRRTSGAGGPPFYPRAHALLLFAAFWTAGWLAMDAAGYRDDAAALWTAAGHLVLVLGTFGVLLRKERILALLPSGDSAAYRRALQVADAAYFPLLFASLAVALLWVAGYRNLAAVFLGRGWAVVGVCLAGFLVYRLAQHLLRRRVLEEAEEEPARLASLAASERLIGLVTVLVVLGLGLRILGLREPLLELFDLTWVQLGSLRLTGSVIWTSALLLVGAVLLSAWAQAMLAYRAYPRLGIGPGEAYALNRLLHYAFIAGAAVLILHNLGLSPESLALVLGGLSVGIGLGLQDIANNLASGLILLTSRQVRKGDVITVGEHMGTVREVNLRSTLVTTFDNVDLLIPNSKLLGDTLINWTHSGTVIRTKVPFGVAYGADPDEVLRIALETAAEHPEVLPEPPPDAWLLRMGDSALEFELLVWVDMRASVRPRVVTQLYTELLRRFRERGIEVPFPQRDLHLRSGVPWKELVEAIGGRGGQPPPNGTDGGDGAAKPAQPSRTERPAGA